MIYFGGPENREKIIKTKILEKHKPEYLVRVISFLNSLSLYGIFFISCHEHTSKLSRDY